jgi:cytochrome oxidase Cu insertion factor (SCO1/SenC/PrrC family)
MPRAFSAAAIAAGFIVLALAPALGFAARQQSNTPAATVDVEILGPQVGDALPDFSLRDQRGQARSLKSLLGPDGAVIVFFRSADW